MNGTDQQAIEHLDALAAALNEAGLKATLRYGSEVPYLQVVNPDLISDDPRMPGPVLSEQIGIVHQAAAPEWMLCWSWGDPLGPADDIPAAVGSLIRVLTLAPATAEA